MVGEFLGELHFFDFVPAERVADPAGGSGVIDGAHVAKGGGRLRWKPGGDQRAPRLGEFVVRVDAHHAEDERDRAEKLAGPFVVVGEGLRQLVGMHLGIGAQRREFRRVELRAGSAAGAARNAADRRACRPSSSRAFAPRATSRRR